MWGLISWTKHQFTWLHNQQADSFMCYNINYCKQLVHFKGNASKDEDLGLKMAVTRQSHASHHLSTLLSLSVSTRRKWIILFNFSLQLTGLQKRVNIYWCCEAVNLLLRARLWGCYVFPCTNLPTNGPLWFVDQAELFGLLSSAGRRPLKGCLFSLPSQHKRCLCIKSMAFELMVFFSLGLWHIWFT